jgi:hypothetical protein
MGLRLQPQLRRREPTSGEIDGSIVGSVETYSWILVVIGFLAFLLWALLCSKTTSCSTMQAVQCVLFWIMTVVLPIAFILEWIVAGFGCALSLAAPAVLWGAAEGWLMFLMTKVKCKRRPIAAQQRMALNRRATLPGRPHRGHRGAPVLQPRCLELCGEMISGGKCLQTLHHARHPQPGSGDSADHREQRQQRHRADRCHDRFGAPVRR